jgi:predicted ATPase
VKILRKGQTAADTLQITKDFDDLDSQFVSVGQSLDYYEHLAQLGEANRDLVLKSLRDVAKTPELQAQFEKEEGWATSLFRDQEPDSIQDFLLLARSLLEGDYTSIPSEELQFSFHMSGWEQPLQFDFTRRSEDPFENWSRSPNELPERVIVLIGPNGSGKSTLLARLARVAHGTAANRRSGVFAALGSLSPIGIGFPRIITVSYSAFDSFTLPGIAPQEEGEPDEREQVVQDVRRGEGRYIFCGLRDIALELEEQIKESNVPAIAQDRVVRTHLKPIGALAAEFSQTLKLIERYKRTREFRKVFDMLATDPSFSFWEHGDGLEGLLKADVEKEFLSWSTGQKIVAQIGASLVAHITPRTLVLIDEPEMHLHPPLLATLMHAVRYLLKKNKAFAIVATHSPVVLQESVTRHVYIVQRNGEVAQISRPMIETFGENVGALSSEVFGLNSQVTDFHRVLDQLITEYKTLDAIEVQFKPFGMSLQARAYVMSRLRPGGSG